MTREEFIKQRCEIDKITEEEFEKRYRVVKCNCGQPYCKGYRCLDLDGLLKENQELKRQLENKYEKVGVLTGELLYEENTKLINKQKEFINYLEDAIQKEKKNLDDLCDIYKVPKGNNSTYKFLCSFVHRIEEILSKYKEIIGDDK